MVKHGTVYIGGNLVGTICVHWWEPGGNHLCTCVHVCGNLCAMFHTHSYVLLSALILLYNLSLVSVPLLKRWPKVSSPTCLIGKVIKGCVHGYWGFVHGYWGHPSGY